MTRNSGFALAASLVLLAGCGAEGRVPIYGEITLDGEPLAEGSIKLVPGASVKGPAVAVQIVGGRYAFSTSDGPAPGEYAVEIYVVEPLPVGLDDPDEYIRRGGPQGMVKQPPNRIDAKFNAQTTLRRTVERQGDRRFDFPVTSTTK